jgi:hypothetical protein
MAIYKADVYFEALCAAGLADKTTRRVVIDIQAGHAAVVHVERWGDERLLDVVRALEGVQISREELRSPEPAAEEGGQ